MQAVRVRTDEVVIGMVVASDVYSSSDQLIITKGTKLDERMITRLRFYNIYGLYVYDGKSDIEPHKEESYIEMLRSTPEFKKFNRTYVGSVEKVEESFNHIIEGGEGNLESLLEETDRILKEGRNGMHIFEMLHGIRNYDDMTYVHSLNVSLICSIFAGWLKMSKEETRILTQAGLLHDIGKMLIPKNIISKP
ncbi:MAG: HD domain-containing protein, partial [Herbinix sp.]|nr:HD domain-containing protein [Herbinix sp.]